MAGSRSPDSSVDTVTGFGLDGRGSIPGMGYFSLLHSVQTGSGTHPAYRGGGGSFSGVNRPVRQADQSPPTSAVVFTAELN
jgi:hypothetical protein